MSGSAHMAMGVFIGAMVVYVARPKVVESAVIFGITTTAILLPDIDEPRSKIGRRYPVISFIIHFLCGHRYLIHSPFLLAILYYLLNSNLQGISFVAGYGDVYKRQPSYNIALEEWNHDKDHVHVLFRGQPKTCLLYTSRCV